MTITGDVTLPNGVAAVLSGNQTLTGGFDETSYNAGTKSSGTFTPDAKNGNKQYVANAGAFTINSPASHCSMEIDIINNSGAGAITFNFTQLDGVAYAATVGQTYRLYLSVGNQGSHGTLKRMV